MAITVVAGPPCSGKTTHVRENSKPGDVVVDFDTLASALGGTAHHEYSAAVREVAHAARSAAIERALRLGDRADVWIIHTQPTRQDRARYLGAGATIHTCHAPLGVLLDRARRERPPEWRRYIADYFDKQETGRRPPGRVGLVTAADLTEL